MKYNRFLTYFFAFSAIALAQPNEAMQNPTQKQDFSTFTVCDFDSEKDMESVTDIFKTDWERLYIGRPFDTKLIEVLIASASDPDYTKKIKVLRHDNKTIGFATYYFFPKRTPKEGTIEVGGLSQEMRGQGLGKEFFPRILTELEEMGSEILTIFVKKDNTVAKNLYEKFGFKIIDENAIRGTSFELAKEIKH